ncbi:uncharacterized protein METZ01_LOCUS272821, partial [marine metagenome]
SCWQGWCKAISPFFEDKKRDKWTRNNRRV